MPRGQQRKATQSQDAGRAGSSPYAERVGPQQYRVGNWWVDLNEETRCHCPDALYRSRNCKHIRKAIAMEYRGESGNE